MNGEKRYFLDTNYIGTSAPSLPAVQFPPAMQPTEDVRKCIKAAKDIGVAEGLA